MSGVSAVVTRPGIVTIRTVDGKRTLTCLIGTPDPDQTEGRGGWSEVPRPRRPAVAEWLGTALPKASLPVLLDAYGAGGTVASQLAVLESMSPLNPTGEQTAVNVYGAWPIQSNVNWLVQDIKWGQRLLRPDGQPSRVEATLELWQNAVADVVVRSSPAKQSQSKNGTAKKARTHTVARGETLSSIAAKFLGSSKKWKTLATLNGLRDPNHLRIGQVLKLP